MRWLVLMLLLAGCAAGDKYAMVKDFNRQPDGSYQFIINADPIYPNESEQAESIRLGWIREYLDVNEACPSGFQVADRQTLKLGKSILGEGHRITYQISCT